ncbi:hypothetical protein ACS0TY_021225 [Phlomoides rotata]
MVGTLKMGSEQGFRENLSVIEIFGKDRATGENAVDLIDLANEIGRNEVEDEGETGDRYVPLSPKGFPDLENNNICKPKGSIGKTSSKEKKRKSVDVDLLNLVDTLGDFMKHSK